MQDDQPPEDDPEEPEEAVEELEAVLEEEERLEPEKEKNTPSCAEEEHLDYCSMEAIAERWRSKPKKSGVASVNPEADASVKPLASVPGIKGKKHPTLLLAEQLRVEGEVAVVQYDTGATPQPR